MAVTLVISIVEPLAMHMMYHLYRFLHALKMMCEISLAFASEKATHLGHIIGPINVSESYVECVNCSDTQH